MKNKIKIYILVLSALMALSFLAAPAAAHPADLYAHTIKINLSQTGADISWEIKPGPLLVSYLWYEADVNQDEILSPEEADEWLALRSSLLLISLDDQPVQTRTGASHFPTDLQTFQAGQDSILINLSAAWEITSKNLHRLEIVNEMESQKSINWFYITALDNAAFRAPVQKNNHIEINFVIDSTGYPDPTELSTTWNSGAPALPFGQQNDPITEASQEVVPELSERTPQEILLDLVREESFSFGFYAFALAISLALGALHALTPGHGKTVVAAYLVGSRGTTWHAIVLGSVVTLTHTGSVFLLGIVTLVASQYFLPTMVIPFLEILSGLLIVWLGIYLFWLRFQQWRKTKAHDNAHAHGLEHDHHDHDHHDHNHDHSHEVPETITWRSLITLGISGGLVPCPDAIAILLVAVAINRIMLGLALILSFSLGLAIVLIVIGLAMVHSARLFARMDAFTKLAPVLPIVSAAIVLLLGIGLTYGAYARLQSGESISLSESSFPVEKDAQIVYLADDINQIRQLYIADANGTSSEQLAQAKNGIVDFAISPDHTQIVYVAQIESLDYELHTISLNDAESSLLVSCVDAVCSQPIWSPNGEMIVYEYMELGGETSGASSLWQYEFATGTPQPLFQEARLPGTNPRFSPDGKWLAYYTPEGIRLFNYLNGESRLIENALGAAVKWSPDSSALLLRDVIVDNGAYITQLFLYDINSDTKLNLSADKNYENILAEWSPDGKQIAVVRRDLSELRGDQVWLMNADGSNARALTQTSAALHGSLNWTADGEGILYDLYLLDSFPIESKLQVVNTKSGKIEDLNLTGYNPKWIK